METEKVPMYLKILLLMAVVGFFFTVTKNIAYRQKAAIIANDKIIVASFVSKHETKLQNGYIVSCMGKAVDNTGNIVNDQILVSVSRLFPTKIVEGLAQIRIQAISDTAKVAIEKPAVNLPELVYGSVQMVAQKVIDLKRAKNEKAFDTSMKKYLASISKSNEMVSLHGYQILAESYTLEGGEVLCK